MAHRHIDPKEWTLAKIDDVIATGRPGASLSTLLPATAIAAALFLSGWCGVSPRKSLTRPLARPQGKSFPHLSAFIEDV